MKEHPRLTLGEDFAQEKSWQWEDITVLTARLTLPKTKGESRREKRFDRYYRALADAYFARCEQKLLPDAAKTCRRHMSKLVKQRCAEGYQGKYTFVIYNKKSIKKNTGEGDSDFHFIFVFFIFQAIVTCIFM